MAENWSAIAAEIEAAIADRRIGSGAGVPGMIRPRAAWVESFDGFPEDWEGQCAGYDIETPHPFRTSALLGPDGEPLRVPLPRNRIGFDLTGGGNG